MAKNKKMHVGIIEFDPRDLTKNQGHDYGAGRRSEVHHDRRNKRRKTRRDRVRESMRGW